MRNPHDSGTFTVRVPARDLAQAGNRIGLAAAALVLAATVMIAIVAPI